eukprot:g4307.t1
MTTQAQYRFARRSHLNATVFTPTLDCLYAGGDATKMPDYSNGRCVDNSTPTQWLDISSYGVAWPCDDVRNQTYCDLALFCQSQQALRLPTVAEADYQNGAGCAFNTEFIWTTTPCFPCTCANGIAETDDAVCDFTVGGNVCASCDSGYVLVGTTCLVTTTTTTTSSTTTSTTTTTTAINGTTSDYGVWVREYFASAGWETQTPETGLAFYQGFYGCRPCLDDEKSASFLPEVYVLPPAAGDDGSLCECMATRGGFCSEEIGVTFCPVTCAIRKAAWTCLLGSLLHVAEPGFQDVFQGYSEEVLGPAGTGGDDMVHVDDVEDDRSFAMSPDAFVAEVQKELLNLTEAGQVGQASITDSHASAAFNATLNNASFLSSFLAELHAIEERARETIEDAFAGVGLDSSVLKVYTPAEVAFADEGGFLLHAATEQGREEAALLSWSSSQDGASGSAAGGGAAALSFYSNASSRSDVMPSVRSLHVGVSYSLKGCSAVAVEDDFVYGKMLAAEWTTGTRTNISGTMAPTVSTVENSVALWQLLFEPDGLDDPLVYSGGNDNDVVVRPPLALALNLGSGDLFSCLKRPMHHLNVLPGTVCETGCRADAASAAAAAGGNKVFRCAAAAPSTSGASTSSSSFLGGATSREYAMEYALAGTAASTSASLTCPNTRSCPVHIVINGTSVVSDDSVLEPVLAWSWDSAPFSAGSSAASSAAAASRKPATSLEEIQYRARFDLTSPGGSAAADEISSGVVASGADFVDGSMTVGNSSALLAELTLGSGQIASNYSVTSIASTTTSASTGTSSAPTAARTNQTSIPAGRIGLPVPMVVQAVALGCRSEAFTPVNAFRQVVCFGADTNWTLVGAPAAFETLLQAPHAGSECPLRCQAGAGGSAQFLRTYSDERSAIESWTADAVNRTELLDASNLQFAARARLVQAQLDPPGTMLVPSEISSVSRVCMNGTFVAAHAMSEWKRTRWADIEVDATRARPPDTTSRTSFAAKMREAKYETVWNHVQNSGLASFFDDTANLFPLCVSDPQAAAVVAQRLSGSVKFSLMDPAAFVAAGNTNGGILRLNEAQVNAGAAASTLGTTAAAAAGGTATTAPPSPTSAAARVSAARDDRLRITQLPAKTIGLSDLNPLAMNSVTGSGRSGTTSTPIVSSQQRALTEDEEAGVVSTFNSMQDMSVVLAFAMYYNRNATPVVAVPEVKVDGSFLTLDTSSAFENPDLQAQTRRRASGRALRASRSTSSLLALTDGGETEEVESEAASARTSSGNSNPKNYPHLHPRRHLFASGPVEFEFAFLAHAYDDNDQLDSTEAASGIESGAFATRFAAAFADTFVDEAGNALQIANVQATVVTDPSPQLVQAARYQYGEWASTCSNGCGRGALARSFQCVTGYTTPLGALCSLREREAIEKACSAYDDCPFDVMCPLGPDPRSFGPCDLWQNWVMGTLFAFVAFLVARYFYYGFFVRPKRGKHVVEFGDKGEKRKIHWEIQDDDEYALFAGKKKVHWKTDDDKLIPEAAAFFKKNLFRRNSMVVNFGKMLSSAAVDEGGEGVAIELQQLQRRDGEGDGTESEPEDAPPRLAIEDFEDEEDRRLATALQLAELDAMSPRSDDSARSWVTEFVEIQDGGFLAVDGGAQEQAVKRIPDVPPPYEPDHMVDYWSGKTANYLPAAVTRNGERPPFENQGRDNFLSLVFQSRQKRIRVPFREVTVPLISGDLVEFYSHTDGGWYGPCVVLQRLPRRGTATASATNNASSPPSKKSAWKPKTKTEKPGLSSGAGGLGGLGMMSDDEDEDSRYGFSRFIVPNVETLRRRYEVGDKVVLFRCARADYNPAVRAGRSSSSRSRIPRHEKRPSRHFATVIEVVDQRGKEIIAPVKTRDQERLFDVAPHLSYDLTVQLAPTRRLVRHSRGGAREDENNGRGRARGSSSATSAGATPTTTVAVSMEPDAEPEMEPDMEDEDNASVYSVHEPGEIIRINARENPHDVILPLELALTGLPPHGIGGPSSASKAAAMLEDIYMEEPEKPSKLPLEQAEIVSTSQSSDGSPIRAPRDDPFHLPRRKAVTSGAPAALGGLAARRATSRGMVRVRGPHNANRDNSGSGFAEFFKQAGNLWALTEDDGSEDGDPSAPFRRLPPGQFRSIMPPPKDVVRSKLYKEIRKSKRGLQRYSSAEDLSSRLHDVLRPT